MDGPKKSDWGILAQLLAQQRRNALESPPLSPLGRALMEAAQQPEIRNPFAPLNSLNQPSTLALSGLFGTTPSPPRTSFGSNYEAPASRPFGAPVVAAAKAKQRSTFYSFHYDDVFRVNHIRNAGVFRPSDSQRFRTPRDKSLWEKARNTNPKALKIMIVRALAGTTVTCVLAGEHTWSRPWVRFEIARSLFRGNGLLTVHIDGCECPNNGFGQRGPSPLSYLALGRDRRIYEFDARGEWVIYDKVTHPLEAWPGWLNRPPPGYLVPLDACAAEYDWIDDNGRQNLIRWTDAAAKAAGR